MTELFPMIAPQAVQTDTALPPYRETAWDFEKGQPIFRDGNPLVVEGAEAVKVWIWKALTTVRARHEIYTWDFGSEIESLIGQPYTDDLKRAEAARYAREAIEGNPYITEVIGVSVDFSGGTLAVAVTVSTVYGEVRVNV